MQQKEYDEETDNFFAKHFKTKFLDDTKKKQQTFGGYKGIKIKTL